MLKKSFFITVLLVLVLACTFAEGSTITVKASPYSYQYVSRTPGFSSKYGFGVEAGYRYTVWKNLSVGAELKYSNYSYSKLTTAYHVISLLPNVGWTQNFGDKWSATGNLGAGIQARFVEGKKGVFFAMNLYLGAGYKVTEKIAITAGADLGLAFQKGSNDLTVDAMLGASIAL